MESTQSTPNNLKTNNITSSFSLSFTRKKKKIANKSPIEASSTKRDDKSNDSSMIKRSEEKDPFILNDSSSDESCSIIDLSNENEGVHVSPQRFNHNWLQQQQCIDIDDIDDIDDIESSDDEIDDDSYHPPAQSIQNKLTRSEHVLVDTDDENETSKPKTINVNAFFQPIKKRLRSNKQSTLSHFVQVHDTNTWFRQNTSLSRPTRSNARNDIQGGSGAGLGGTIVMPQNDDDCIVLSPPQTSKTKKSEKKPKKKRNYFKNRFRRGRKGANKRNSTTRSSWSNYQRGFGQYRGNTESYSIAKQDPELNDIGGARLIFN